MIKKLLMLMTAAVLIVGLMSGCSTNKSDTPAPPEKPTTASTLGVTEDAPIAIDQDAKTVTVLAKVNGKYFSSPTRHALVYKDGKFGDKSVFQSLCDPLTFHDALVKIGAQPGENMKMDTAQQTHVEGDILKVEVITPDKTIDLNEAIIDSKHNPIEMRFGGNHAASEEYKTGCLACLDSCPVGIVSNHTYTLGAVEETKEVEFFGNQQVLPPDGTLVALKFTLQPHTAAATQTSNSCTSCGCEDKK